MVVGPLRVSRMRKQMAASTVAMAMFLGACSGTPADAPGAAGPASDQPSASAEKGKGRGGAASGKGSSGKKDRKGDAANDAGGSGSGSDPDSSNEGGSNGGEESSGDPATGSARVTDPSGDADPSGEAPSYTDMVKAAVQGLGRTVRLTATFRGVVPQKMDDDDTFMSVEIKIHKGGRTYAVYADGNDEGWTAYLSERADNRRLEGAFSIEGETTVFEIPWGLIGGPGPFRWTARSAWTRTTLTNTLFAFDNAPEGKKARYPD